LGRVDVAEPVKRHFSRVGCVFVEREETNKSACCVWARSKTLEGSGRSFIGGWSIV
jgi:hypothetical protein